MPREIPKGAYKVKDFKHKLEAQTFQDTMITQWYLG